MKNLKNSKNSRTLNIAKNSLFGLITQVINIILNFLSRTIFIYFLGVEYLGISGLFSNLLMVLSFAELGIGNAIVYGMYKPLAINDNEKLKSLMNLYAKTYRIIGIFIFIFGLIIIPFMDLIIKEMPNIKENINIVYILFLLNTSLSYFFVYKKSIITADQKNYIILFYQQVFKIFQTIAQIFFLWLTGEYIIFLIIQIIITLIDNIYMSLKADKMYPFLKEKKVKNLDKSERNLIFSNVKALFLYKFGSVILNGTDNIIISSVIGITAVGLNSNYLLIVSAITAILGQIMGGFTASVGNLNAIGDKLSKERAFDKIFFISAWLFGFCAIGLLLFLNPLITIWIGEEFIFSNLVVFAIVLHFYINGMQFATYTYRVTMGLFVQGRWTPLIAAIINIVLSFWLGNKIGIAGIFFATSIARFFTTGIVDPILVYRKGFNKSPIKYYVKYFSFLALFTVLYSVLDFIIDFITLGGISGFILQIILVTIIFNGAMLLIFWRNKDFLEIRNIILNTMNLLKKSKLKLMKI